ncbi:MAG: transporter [Planctomycetales bacterium]|nr:transporter [Planctomycetales bacterium]
MHGEVAQSWTIRCSLTDRLGSYTEWFVFVPSGAETGHTEHYFDGGLTYLWSNDLQFDVRAGWGASNASTDFFTGAGMAIRF